MKDIKYMEEYFKNLNKFDELVNFAIGISHCTGVQQTSNQSILVHQVFSRIVLTSMSIQRLCPRSSDVDKEFCDWPSIASLSRNLLESYAFLFHLINCKTPEEQDFSQLLINYHWNSEKYKMYLAMGYEEESLMMQEFSTGLPIEKEKIQCHNLYSALPKEKQRLILNGKLPATKSTTEILKDMNFNDLPIQGMYKFFSNQVHTSPMGFRLINNERGRGIINEAEISHIGMALDFNYRFIIKASSEMIDIFPNAKIAIEIVNYIKDKYSILQA